MRTTYGTMYYIHVPEVAELSIVYSFILLIHDWSIFICWFIICVFCLLFSLCSTRYFHRATKILLRRWFRCTSTSSAIVLRTRIPTSGPGYELEFSTQRDSLLAASPSCTSSTTRGAMSFATSIVDSNNVGKGPSWGRCIRYRPRTRWFELSVWRSSR